MPNTPNYNMPIPASSHNIADEINVNLPAALAIIDTEMNSNREQINNLDALKVTPHLADLITDADGAHGLKVEEGTWSPTLNSNPTFTTQLGKYYKIGKKVTAYGKLVYSAKGTDPSAQLQITNLPFANANLTLYTAQILDILSPTILADTTSRLSGFMQYAVVYLKKISSVGTTSNVMYADINASGAITFAITYLTT